jgi:hypothetical protein
VPAVGRESEDVNTNSTSADEAGSETALMGSQQDSDALTQPQLDFVQDEAPTSAATSEANAGGEPSADAGEKPVEAISSSETETDENNSEDAG